MPLDLMPASNAPVVILCGGLGTRLRSVVADRPKVLADVAGRPFLGHLLDLVGRQGFVEVVLSAGHLADQVEAFAKAGAPPGMRVAVVAEREPLGTAGALRYACAEAGITGPFVALNGDTYFSGGLADLLDAHGRRRDEATVGLVRVPDAGRYGAVRFDEATGHVTAFEEKGPTGPGWINAGAYALEPGVVANVPAGGPVSLERDILPRLIGRGLGAVAYSDAAFLDIGTPADYARAESLLAPPTPL